MLIPDPPPPLLGVMGRTRRGIERLTAENLQPWAGGGGDGGRPRSEDWWIDRQAGVAFHRPELVVTGLPGREPGVLAIRGSFLGGRPRREPPAGWPQRAAEDVLTAFAYELLDRDTAALADFRGQFSVALWDGRRRRLLLARDHLGQRSLFLRTDTDWIVFCSELEPLLRVPGAGCDLDLEGAFWFLAFGLPPPGRTLVRRVDRLPAAHVLVWEPEQPPLIHRYWTPLTATAPREATPEVLAEIRTTLDAAVARRCFRSAPSGIFLSGGVDSTYLSATAVALGAPLSHAFTAAFEPIYGMNETPYAAAVADWLGLRHEVVELRAGEAADLLQTVVLAAAEPTATWASLTHVRLLAHARRLGVEGLLSGLGADEVFGGYDHFRGFHARFLRHARRHPAPPGLGGFEALLLAESQASRRVLYPGIARFFDDSALRRGLKKPFRDWHYASHLRAFYRECLRLKPEAQNMEMMVAHECQHRIPDMLFGNFETLSRRMGVEVRYPFLDPDVVRQVTGLAVESRYRTPAGRFSLRLRDLEPGFKHAMLRLAAERVPPEIVQRPRKSFTAPFGGWLSQAEFAGPVLDALRRSRLWQVGLVDASWLGHVLERVGPNPSPAVFQLWALVSLAGWYDRYVDPP